MFEDVFDALHDVRGRVDREGIAEKAMAKPLDFGRGHVFEDVLRRHGRSGREAHAGLDLRGGEAAADVVAAVKMNPFGEGDSTSYCIWDALRRTSVIRGGLDDAFGDTRAKIVELVRRSRHSIDEVVDAVHG